MKNTHTKWITAAVLLCLPVVTMAMDLFMNSGRVLTFPEPIKAVYVSNPNMVDFNVRDKHSIYLFAKAMGSSSLVVTNQEGKTIFDQTVDVKFNLNPLRKMIKKTFPSAHANVSNVNNTLLVKGYTHSAAVVNKIMELVKNIVPEKFHVMNLMKVVGSNEINLRVKVVEMSREITRDFGLDWNTLLEQSTLSFTNQIPGTAGVNAITFSGSFSVDQFVKALDEDGLATILSEPNLTALSGKTAHFLVGGEFPIIVPQGGGSSSTFTVEYKQYGVSLGFTPTRVNNNLINLQLRTEVSQLSDVGAVVISGFRIPGLITRRALTTVDLASGQSFAIAGLLQNNVQKTNRGLSGLDRLPILGQLFRSEEYKRNETELVIIVTPYFVDSKKESQLSTPADQFVNNKGFRFEF